MNKTGKISLLLTAISVISIGLAMGIFFPWGNLHALGQDESGQNENINEERFYDIESIKDLKISVSSGDIRIKQVSSGKLRVHLHGRSSGQKPFLADSQSGSSLSVEVKRKSGFGFSSSRLILDIDLPEDYDRNLTLNSSSGDINIPDLELEDLQIDLSSGDLNVNSLTVRNFIYDSSSGDLTADRIESSETRLEASSGSITIDRFTGNLEADLSSGEIEIVYIDFNNKISVHNSSGDIVISLPPEAEFRLDADTSSGDIICNYPITIEGSQKRGILKGTVGSGDNLIQLETSSGDISILKN